MFKHVQPRIAMVTHLIYDEAFVPEMVAGIRLHWDGLFQFGARDVVVVNVTKDAIWARRSALAEDANFCRPSKKDAIELFDLSPTHTTIDFPNPKTSVAENEGSVPRNVEYNPRLYYPADVYRKPNPVFPKDFKIDIKQMMGEKIEAKVEAKLEQVAGKIGDKPKAGEARQIAKQFGEALADAKTPFDLLGILQEFGHHVSDKEVLAEVMTNAKTVAELLKKGQELGKPFGQAQALGDPVKQLLNIGKMLKGGG